MRGIRPRRDIPVRSTPSSPTLSLVGGLSVSLIWYLRRCVPVEVPTCVICSTLPYWWRWIWSFLGFLGAPGLSINGVPTPVTSLRDDPVTDHLSTVVPVGSGVWPPRCPYTDVGSCQRRDRRGSFRYPRPGSLKVLGFGMGSHRTFTLYPRFF